MTHHSFQHEDCNSTCDLVYLLGSFIGAKLEKNDFVSSLKISVGALIGFFGGVIAKLAYVFFAMYHSILII